MLFSFYCIDFSALIQKSHYNVLHHKLEYLCFELHDLLVAGSFRTPKMYWKSRKLVPLCVSDTNLELVDPVPLVREGPLHVRGKAGRLAAHLLPVSQLQLLFLILHLGTIMKCPKLPYAKKCLCLRVFLGGSMITGKFRSGTEHQ